MRINALTRNGHEWLRWLRTTSRHLLWALLFTLHGGAAQARELLAVGTQFPRVFEWDAKGPARGLAVDLLSKAAAQQGHTVRFEALPWARAQMMVELGQADVLIGPYRSPERLARFLFSELAFYEDALVFYASPALASLWTGDWNRLSGRSVGLVLGWAYGNALEQARSKLLISNPGDVATGLRMLQRGRIELLASNERNTAPVLESMGLAQQFQALQPPIAVQAGHFAYPRTPQGEELRQALDRSLEALRQSGVLRDLARQWGVRTPD
ncbi:substrate-binding periplasmic protein [Paucibacter sp. Y2R2-4]|uniref:substrate-binding periplasmic protein n=1 Tax=Paucibacter sp. Y2R2-4 TaxID=2893553 RepID=UPI0021E4A3B6|nr:transporter substrate-binding domain-containing protein [Paucibacter sp. Y2R2-4]MCV2350919.1 transporter substrate-binding domain-containing protein [Paucibacter sp. Y2R2-4]